MDGIGGEEAGCERPFALSEVMNLRDSVSLAGLFDFGLATYSRRGLRRLHRLVSLLAGLGRRRGGGQRYTF